VCTVCVWGVCTYVCGGACMCLGCTVFTHVCGDVGVFVGMDVHKCMGCMYVCGDICMYMGMNV
jgi:hypothetical protein